MVHPLQALFFLLATTVLPPKEVGPTAQTENGPVVGTYDVSFAGKVFLAFKGIPYAQPPLGNLRFEEPQRYEGNWTEPRLANEYREYCLQLNEFNRTKMLNGSMHFHVQGSEDCLYLNIFTRIGGPAKKNVLFFIHGGAFSYGAGEQYGPDYVMDRDDIIYVTFNYRLGPMGFLTTGDDVVPGNSGLKDQFAALKWINRNIANFGGDPEKVTIAGASAGAASVDYMFLTNDTKGLFRNGCSFSGTALTSWGLITDGVERTQRLAQNFGCPVEDSRELVACLRQQSAHKIVDEMRFLMIFEYNPFTVFGPVIEVNSSRPFIKEHPRKVHQEGRGQDLPWLAGVTAQGGLYPAAEFITRAPLLRQLNDNWSTKGYSLLFLDPKLSEKERRKKLEAVRKYYFGNKPINKATRETMVRLLTARNFDSGIVETVQLRKGAYLYQYGYQAISSFSQTMSGTKLLLGACHLDDVAQSINEQFDPSHYTARDRRMAKVMNEIFFNFVVDGKVPEKYDWPSMQETGGYLRINSPTDIFVTDAPLVDFELQNSLYN